MKKGIIVLLIAVLVSGFAFAGFTGNAKITFGTDLDAKTFGFGNWATGKYTFEFTYDTLAAGKDAHETDLWAEIAATGSVKLASTAEIKAGTDVHAADSVKAEAAGAITATFTITKANIHVKDFTFGILNMGVGPDYAKSYYLNAAGKAPENDTLKGPSRFVPGFTVSYKDYNAGFGIKGNWINDKVEVATAGWVETKAFTFGENDEFTAQAGAYAQYYNDHRIGVLNAKFAGVAAKAGYGAEKLTANAAADLQIIRNAGKNNFAYEVSADATYTINANGSVYAYVYMTPGILTTSTALYADAEKTPKLDAKVGAKYDFDFDGTKLETTAYVDVRDILVGERSFDVKATEKLTLDKVVLEFSEEWGYFSTEIFKPITLKAYAFTFTAKATYTAEKFEAFASIDSLTFGKFEVESDSVSLLMLSASCGIKSTKIIENAEIGATYKGFGFNKIFDNENSESVITKGAIEVYATISF